MLSPVCGLAMGIAKIIIGYSIFTFCEISLQQYRYSFYHHIREIWIKYMGDCVTIWKETIEKLFDFKLTLSSINSQWNIKKNSAHF